MHPGEGAVFSGLLFHNTWMSRCRSVVPTYICSYLPSGLAANYLSKHVRLSDDVVMCETESEVGEVMQCAVS